MLTWLLLGLALLYVQTLIPPTMELPRLGLMGLLGPRDDQDSGVATLRARRAMWNLLETLPIFLTLGLVSLILPTEQVAAGQALLGAQVYVIARAVFVPIYIVGIPGLRTLAYLAAVAGLVMMTLAIL